MYMEVKKWKRDEMPYYIFACFKCGRMLYVKTVQKTKKCLTCNRVHQVAKLPHNTEMVYGMSKAIDAVKQKQNALAILETGHTPDLRTNNDFHTVSHSIEHSIPNKKLLKSNEIDINYAEAFKALLKDLSLKFTRFPGYMILMMAPDYHIPEPEVPILLSTFTQKGYLVVLQNDYYTIK